MNTVLILTGPPAVGKSTVGRLVAERRERCAMVDIDDIRHFVISHHAAPWEGDEGTRQQRLGVLNGCSLAKNFVSAGIDVVIVDVLDNNTAALYQELLDDSLIIRLEVSYEEALRRAKTRAVHLSWEEFRALHVQQGAFTSADVSLDTTQLSPDDTASAVLAHWTARSGR